MSHRKTKYWSLTGGKNISYLSNKAGSEPHGVNGKFQDQGPGVLGETKAGKASEVEI